MIKKGAVTHLSYEVGCECSVHIHLVVSYRITVSEESYLMLTFCDLFMSNQENNMAYCSGREAGGPGGAR